MNEILANYLTSIIASHFDNDLSAIQYEWLIDALRKGCFDSVQNFIENKFKQRAKKCEEQPR